MGPQHPSTHGVLRLILELEGETVTEARCGIGYLHTGIEKNMEFRTWTQGVTFCTRMDYLSPFFNEATYVMGVERLLDIEDDVPEKAQVMRVLLMELNRISSHLVAIATGGMEIGALTVMTMGFRERELVLDLFELITGLRMKSSEKFMRICRQVYLEAAGAGAAPGAGAGAGSVSATASWTAGAASSLAAAASGAASAALSASAIVSPACSVTGAAASVGAAAAAGAAGAAAGTWPRTTASRALAAA